LDGVGLTTHVWESSVTGGKFELPHPAPMSRKKISTTVYITSEQSEALHTLHDRTKVPVAVYIREGIDLVLKQYAHELPGQMSLGEAASAPKKKR
jgi:hypothetical protein